VFDGLFADMGTALKTSPATSHLCAEGLYAN
jgi:hypothetical protein